MFKYLLLLILFIPSFAYSATCGGVSPCSCGDTLTSNHTMSYDLVCSTGISGITLSGVDHIALNCNGHSITGPGWRTGNNDAYGIYIRDNNGTPTTASTVSNCTVSGFKVGIRERASSIVAAGPGTGNIISSNVVTANGDSVAHSFYGIELSNASSYTIISGNTVTNNADEGIHVGTGADISAILANTIRDNFRENLYILDADSIQIIGNTIGSTSSSISTNALYIKNASYWTITDNIFQRKRVHITGSSVGNIFANNSYTSSAGLLIDYYADPTLGNLTPFGNTFTNEIITGNGSGTCIAVSGAQDTIFTNPTLTSCGSPNITIDDGGGVVNSNVQFVGYNPVSTSIGAGGTISVGWTLGFHIQNGSAVAVPGARVIVKDSANATLLDSTTDASGNIASSSMLVTRGNARVSRNPLTVNVMASGYRNNNTQVTLTANTTSTISLTALP